MALKPLFARWGINCFQLVTIRSILHIKCLTPLPPDEVNTDPYRQSFDYSLSRAYGERNKYYEDPISATEAGATEPQEVKLIAFYLPQFHPFPEMMNGGGERALRNGQTSAKPLRSLSVIINHVTLDPWVIMTCEFRKTRKNK